MIVSDVLLIILGWLFGLLSPAIITIIRDKREAKIIKTALISELNEFQYRLILNAYLIESRYGILNSEFFKWVQSILVEYKGINSSDSFLETIKQTLKFTEDEIITYAQVWKQQKKPNSCISLRKHSLSLLDTNIAALSRFDPILRGQLLEIKTRIGFLNEIIDDARYHYQLSFQNGISTGNYEIANSNMIDSYKFYASRARDIIEIIGKILNKK